MNSVNDNKNNNNLYINIYKIIDFIYSENFHDILIKEKTRFINNIENKILDILKRQHKNNESEYKTELLLFEKEKKTIQSRYDLDFLLLNTEYLRYKKYPSKVKYLKKFRRHCINLGQIPLHKCNSNKYGKFIEIEISYNNNRNKISYIKKGESKPFSSYLICTECSKCYYSSFIKMFCSCCKTEYFSSKLEESENENILPSTWKDYHCKPIIVNEMMKCVKCENILYINLINKKLCCLNKRCNFSSDSQSIIWKCKICQKDFHSSAKIFNPLENKILQNAVFKSLLYKDLCLPQKIYCCCLINKDVKYFHNRNCSGELYKGIVDNKPIVVCGKCHAVNFYAKFIWICPLCGIKFYSHGTKYKKDVVEVNKNLVIKNNRINNSNELNKHKNLYSLEKYYSENKNKYNHNCDEIEEENKYINNNKNHKHNFSSNIRLFNKENGGTPKYFDYKKTTFDNVKRKEELLKNTIFESNAIPKYKYLKRKKKIKYKTLYDILEEREKNKNNESVIDINNTNNYRHKYNFNNNNPKDNRLSDIQIIKKEKIYLKPHTSMKKEKNSLIQNYFILSDHRQLDLNKKIKEKKSKNNGKNRNIIDISGSEDLMDKPTDKTEIEEKTINTNLKQKLSGDLHSYSNSFLVNSIKNEKKNSDLRISNYREKYTKQYTKQYTKKYTKNNNSTLTIDENGKNDSSYNKNISQYKRNREKLLKESNSTLQKNNRPEIILKSDLKKEIIKVDMKNTIEREKKYIRKFKHEDIEKMKYNKIKKRDEEKENNSDNEINNKYNYKYKSSRIEQNQFFKKIYLNRMKDNINLIEQNKDNNIIKEESHSNIDNLDNIDNIENEKGEIGICPFGDLGESLVSKEEFIKISKECKIPSFEENNIEYIKPIGQGSFGVIYLVEDKNSKKQYALKRVLCNDIEQILKHKNEFELSYSLNHPNLIRIYKVLFKYLDMTTYLLFVLMEKAETDWNSEINRRKKENINYTEEELINIMKQLVNVFAYFQKNNIVHRDIKPQNILIFDDNKYKISDLGEAKNTNNINKMATLKGNQFFMSPNLFFALKNNGNQKVKHNIFKSDVFSLGFCFLYAMALDLKLIKSIREITSMNEIISIIKQFGLEDKYSNKFINIIYKMIQVDENKRCDFVELYQDINKIFS